MMNFISDDNKPRKVAIYIRVSTAEQKMDGYGLDVQERRLTEYIEINKGLKVDKTQKWIYEDTHTGSDLNRVGLEQLMEDVQKHKFETVVVWKIDRLSRNLRHLLGLFEKLKENRVSFISVQENIDFRGPIGNLIFQIFGAIAEFERDLIKGRTVMGRIASAELGNYTGSNVPYGYKPIENPEGKGKKLAIINEEKKWVIQIYRWYIYDDLGDNTIAKKMNELKIPKGQHTRCEKDKFSPWTEKNIRTILTSTIYKGAFVANQKDENGDMLPENKWIIVEIPQCISETTFKQAEIARTSRTGGNKSSRKYLLSGKLRDYSVDPPRAFVGAPRTKGGYSYRRKKFPKDGIAHSTFEIPGKQIEEYAWKKVLSALKDPDLFIKNYKNREYQDPTRRERLEKEISSLKRAIINIELQQERLDKAYLNGKYDEERMGEISKELNQELAKVQTKLNDKEEELEMFSILDMELTKLKEASESVKYQLDNLSHDSKYIICQLFIDKIKMYREIEKGKKPKIKAVVSLRFNPQKLAEKISGGRTQKELKQSNKSTLKAEIQSSGAQSGT